MKFVYVGLCVLCLLMLSGCEEIECGYGGPGCGDPRLSVSCGFLIVGEKSDVEVQYTDDVGPHPATVYAAKSLNTQVVEVKRLDSSTIEIKAISPGDGQLYLDIQGWNEPVKMPFKVVASKADLTAADIALLKDRYNCSAQMYESN